MASQLDNPRSLLFPTGSMSCVRGEAVPELWRHTIPQIFSRTVQEFGEREAVVFLEHGIRWTWAEFEAKVERITLGLLSFGLNKGDRVGIWSPNRPEWLLTQYATAGAGLILVNINPAYRSSELRYVLDKAGCKALISAERFKTSNYISMIMEVAPEITNCEPGKVDAPSLPQLHLVITTGTKELAGFVCFDDLQFRGGEAERRSLAEISDIMSPSDIINIQFTSGTTGVPKGASLTHVNILNNGRFVADRLKLTGKDVVAIPVPLYHCFGMVMGSLACVSTGAKMVFPGEGFDPERTLSAIETECCTTIFGVPTMFAAQLDSPRFIDFNTSSLRTGIMAGAPCPIKLMRRVVSQMGASEITVCYGMTETSPVSFQSHTDDSLDRRVSTVGQVLPHLEVKIVDPNTKEVIPIGAVGELCTKGYSVMAGYWDDAEATAKVIDQDGFMHTGDLAMMDKEGYVQITGRIKDMVIRGGENIYPREVEELLYSHPSVQMVQVFGVPDALYGEELCAWIIRRKDHHTTASEIREFCRSHIAHYKIPKYVEFVESVPMTVTGKPQKFKMRAEMVKRLGLVERHGQVLCGGNEDE